MSGKNKKSLSDQLEAVYRKLDGHVNNDNSNRDRYFRLLMRAANLEAEINATRRAASKKKNSGKRSSSGSTGE